MTLRRLKILYIDDDIDFYRLVSAILEKDKSTLYNITYVQNKTQFLRAFNKKKFDMIVSDFDLKEFDGFEIIETIRKKDTLIPILIVTGSGSEEIAVECMKKGANDYIIKNFEHIKKLPFAINSAYEKAQLVRESKAKDISLKETHDELQLIMNTIHSAIIILDEKFRIIRRNPYAQYFLNVRNSKIINQPICAFINDRSFSETLVNFSESKKESVRFELTQKMDNSKKHFLIILHKFSDKKRYLLIAVDFTDRKEMEEELILYREHLEKMVEQKAQRLIEANQELMNHYQELKKLEAEMRRQRQEKVNILDNLMEGVVFVDNHGNINWLNRAASDIFQVDRDSCISKPFTFLLHERSPFREQTWEFFGQYPFLKEFKDALGRWWELKIYQVKDENNNIIGTLNTLWEITEIKRSEEERKQFENQLLHKQKLESIGTLASGVAHEINNPMTGIINYAKLLRNRIEDQNLKLFAEGIIEEGERISAIVKNLLAFSRKEQAKTEQVNIARLIQSSVNLVKSIMRKEHIRIEVKIPEDFPLVPCRPQQIQQVLINLLTNAHDALQAKTNFNDNKTISIYCRILNDSDKMAQIIIEDNGIGISSSILERIYDPFFTTKSRDAGTGLGLSVSYGIIQRHGGQLRCESKEGEFTRFFIDLPLESMLEIESINS